MPLTPLPEQLPQAVPVDIVQVLRCSDCVAVDAHGLGHEREVDLRQFPADLFRPSENLTVADSAHR